MGKDGKENRVWKWEGKGEAAVLKLYKNSENDHLARNAMKKGEKLGRKEGI